MHRNSVDAIDKWNPNRPALFYVIDRNGGGLVSKFKVSAPLPYFPPPN